jgi:hypothetical protein
MPMFTAELPLGRAAPPWRMHLAGRGCRPYGWKSLAALAGERA